MTKKLSDEQIKAFAENAGFWGVKIWWMDNIPRFRAFLERAKKNSTHGKNDQKQDKKIEALESALKIIRTWANFDLDEGYLVALVPKDVVNLCDKVLGKKRVNF